MKELAWFWNLPKPHSSPYTQNVRRASILGPPSAKRQGSLAMTLRFQTSLFSLSANIFLLCLFILEYLIRNNNNKANNSNSVTSLGRLSGLILQSPKATGTVEKEDDEGARVVLESGRHGKGPLALGAWRPQNTRPTHFSEIEI